jgi:DNA-binding MarR family transcriptional regulator
MRKTFKPSSGPPTIESVLYSKPGYLIRRLQQIAVSIFFEETAAFDITPIQYATLATVSVYPGIDQLRVANAVGLDRTTIGGVLERLEFKELLNRQHAPYDRRARMLYPTAKGERLLRDIQKATQQVQDRILEPLGTKEQQNFIASLERLVQSHNEISRVPINEQLLPGRSAAAGRLQLGTEAPVRGRAKTK